MKNIVSIKKISFLLIMIFLLLFVNEAYSQIRYTETDTVDGVVVMHRWRRSNLFDKESRTMLNLRLVNTNEYHVNVELAVGFYKSGIIVYESEDMEKCFNPGQGKRGGLAGFRFQSEDLTREEIESEKFDWDFTLFEVEKIDDCP